VPKGIDNASLILQAARDLFLERGYSATSMDNVANAAGVSKATVYALFGSKDELFAAMVEREGENQTIALSRDPKAAVDDVLHTFGRAAAELLVSESVVGIHRIVASETSRSPDVGRLFYANGPDHLIEDLAGYLGLAMKRGDLRSAPPRLAAAQFLQIIVADLQFRALMGLGRPSPRTRNAAASSGVDVFLRGYAPRSDP
jgi:TetR/AcrR family transcriptional regulator, mexJK operon transcriptional repressor